MLGWLFGRTPTKASVQGHKTVVVGGMKFVVRRLNPLHDFQGGSMPMVFSDTTRVPEIDVKNPAIAKRLQEDMYAVVRAGVVDPPLAAPGKPELNVEDIFRDPQVGLKLYVAIIEYSLIRFSGVRRPFFFLARLLSRYTTWRKLMAKDRATSPSRESILA